MQLNLIRTKIGIMIEIDQKELLTEHQFQIENELANTNVST